MIFNLFLRQTTLLSPPRRAVIHKRPLLQEGTKQGQGWDANHLGGHQVDNIITTTNTTMTFHVFSCFISIDTRLPISRVVSTEIIPTNRTSQVGEESHQSFVSLERRFKDGTS